METFKIQYYKTENHFNSDADDWLEDEFYSEVGYMNKAGDLMYRLNYYKIIVYKSSDLFNPIRSFIVSKAFRKQFKNYKQNKNGRK